MTAAQRRPACEPTCRCARCDVQFGEAVRRADDARWQWQREAGHGPVSPR